MKTKLNEPPKPPNVLWHIGCTYDGIKIWEHVYRTPTIGEAFFKVTRRHPNAALVWGRRYYKKEDGTRGVVNYDVPSIAKVDCWPLGTIEERLFPFWDECASKQPAATNLNGSKPNEKQKGKDHE
jgi:hypothetical protein